MMLAVFSYLYLDYDRLKRSHLWLLFCPVNMIFHILEGISDKNIFHISPKPIFFVELFRNSFYVCRMDYLCCSQSSSIKEICISTLDSRYN